jgi:hypothetical protein
MFEKRPEIPHLETDPAYAAALAKLHEVQADEADTARELREANHRAAQSLDPDAEARRAAAATYLAGGAVDLDAESAADRLRRLARSAEIKAEAVKLQTANVEAARREALAEMKSRFDPHHAAAVVEIAKAVVGVGRANVAEAALRNEAHVAGYGDAFPHSLFAGVGDLRDPNSPANLYLAELVKTGFLTGAEDFLAGTAIYKGGR